MFEVREYRLGLVGPSIQLGSRPVPHGVLVLKQVLPEGLQFGVRAP
jgi:hypothetical protein